MAHKSTNEESATRLLGLQKDLGNKLINGTRSLDDLYWFNNLSKDTLRQLALGNYELVKKKNLQKGDIITLHAVNDPTSILFSTSKTGRDKQYHSDSFKKLISEVLHIEVPEMNVQIFSLRKKMNDFEIRNELGGNDKLCFASKALAIRALGSTTTDAYRDSKPTIVYYMDEDGELCCADCYLNSGNAKWHCYAGRASDGRWFVGSRVAYPST